VARDFELLADWRRQAIPRPCKATTRAGSVHQLDDDRLAGRSARHRLPAKIDAVIDFSFIHDRVAGLYCPDNGRPPLDPTVMFKALFIGYLIGVRSERQLVREIEVNVAYRWFLGLELTDPVFDASTLSQNRRRRYNDTTVAQDIFDAIVEQAIARGLVDGTVLYTDSTHLKANANKNRYDTAVVAKSRADYWEALDTAIERDRAEHDKKPLPQKERQPAEKETKVSRTDQQSGYMVRDGKPKASSISITAPWTVGSALSPTLMRRRSTCTIPSFI
jgi:transposase